ncbi:MAG: OmpH family outer membrane protein [Saprospiraceae bacterium]
MNKLSYTILCFVFIFISLTSCKKNDTGVAVDPNSTTATKIDQPKVVYVDIDTLLTKYNLYIDKKNQLEAESKAAEKSLAGKIEAFQKRAAKFQNDVMEIQQKANTIAPIELKKLEEKFAGQQQNLAKEEEALMKQRESAAIDLEKKLMDTQKDLQDKLDVYLAKVAEEKGYEFVLMKGTGGSVMFGKSSLDITLETVQKLNAEYEAQKEAKTENK